MNNTLKNQIEKEMETIMEVQNAVTDIESEDYKIRERAVEVYADILKTIQNEERAEKELELKEKELIKKYEQMNEELKVKFGDIYIKKLQEENLLKQKEIELKLKEKELDLKEKELEMQKELDEKKMKQERNLKIAGGIVIAGLVIVTLKHEDLNVIATKTFGPVMNAAVRVFTI